VTDVVKITETGLKIMEAEELSIGDKIAEKYAFELSLAIPVRTMIPAHPPALVSWENSSANNAYVFTSPGIDLSCVQTRWQLRACVSAWFNGPGAICHEHQPEFLAVGDTLRGHSFPDVNTGTR
jgi:hypothetical protein